MDDKTAKRTEQLICGDCLIKMDEIPDNSVDLIFTDLPYGTTRNKWDERIDLNKLWTQYKRVIKENGCIALWAQPPFDKILACSNLPIFRYEWIIEKTSATGFLNAKKMPMKAHENVLIFYRRLPKYYPQKTTGHEPVHFHTNHTGCGPNYGKTRPGYSGGGSTERYPRDVLRFKWDTQKSHLHPTQKPLEACKYFIRTYTDPGDLVLDSCMGSNTTGKACRELGRSYIGIEVDPEIFQIAKNR